jgi:hypothetical protein
MFALFWQNPTSPLAILLHWQWFREFEKQTSIRSWKFGVTWSHFKSLEVIGSDGEFIIQVQEVPSTWWRVCCYAGIQFQFDFIHDWFKMGKWKCTFKDFLFYLFCDSIYGWLNVQLEMQIIEFSLHFTFHQICDSIKLEQEVRDATGIWFKLLVLWLYS